jgi:hypothetical protein
MSEFDVTDDFKVDTLDKAAWVMRKYSALARRVAANDALAEAEHRRIQTWQENANAPLLSRMEWWEEHLKAYAFRLRAEGQKSLSLPYGEVKTRQTTPTFEVDKAVFVEWAQEQKREDLLRISVAPDLSKIKGSLVPDGQAAVDPASGEIVPGLIPVPESISITITPDLTASDFGDDDDDE